MLKMLNDILDFIFTKENLHLIICIDTSLTLEILLTLFSPQLQEYIDVLNQNKKFKFCRKNFRVLVESNSSLETEK
jgi:hypothetical protein